MNPRISLQASLGVFLFFPALAFILALTKTLPSSCWPSAAFSFGWPRW